jgi:inner membrane protein involved in colicin E2 resistance
MSSVPYGVLMSEDRALLMRAALLLTAIAVTMLVTRYLDWSASAF